MPKFILVRDYCELDKVKDYIKKHPKNSYYVAPRLMNDYLTNLRYQCVIGLTLDDIKSYKHSTIDLLTMPVYNKVFEQFVFRIEAIKSPCLCKLEHKIEYDEIVFGLNEDRYNYWNFDVEQI